MELQTVSQVSKEYNISARMLRYYEQCGLLSSLRTEDYSYRVYDSENRRRLQHIIILRKLQIPIKQIHIILENPKTATAIDIFNKNIQEIQDEITALETIKSSLKVFITKIKEASEIQLDFNLMTDEYIIKIAKSLPLAQKNINQNRILKDINVASNQLNKLKEKFVRVVSIPSYTVAKASCKIDYRDLNDPWKVYTDAKTMINNFIKDTELIKVKPDFRYFLSGNAEITSCEIMITIPEALEVPAPLIKHRYYGGLFAAYINTPDNFDDWKILEAWVKNNNDYIWDPRTARLEEYINPDNIYNLKKENSEYYDFLLPIKEI